MTAICVNQKWRSGALNAIVIHLSLQPKGREGIPTKSFELVKSVFDEIVGRLGLQEYKDGWEYTMRKGKTHTFANSKREFYYNIPKDTYENAQKTIAICTDMYEEAGFKFAFMTNHGNYNFIE